MNPDRLRIWYVRALGGAFIVQGAAGALLKLAQDRAHDLPHSVLHVVSGAVAVAMAWGPGASRRATGFAIAFGAAYLALGVGGALASIPLPVFALETPDHIFHTTIGTLTLLVGSSAAWAKSRHGPAQDAA